MNFATQSRYEQFWFRVLLEKYISDAIDADGCAKYSELASKARDRVKVRLAWWGAMLTVWGTHKQIKAYQYRTRILGHKELAQLGG